MIWFLNHELFSDQAAVEMEARMSPLIYEKKKLFNDLLTAKGRILSGLWTPFVTNAYAQNQGKMGENDKYRESGTNMHTRAQTISSPVGTYEQQKKRKMGKRQKMREVFY